MKMFHYWKMRAWWLVLSAPTPTKGRIGVWDHGTYSWECGGLKTWMRNDIRGRDQRKGEMCSKNNVRKHYTGMSWTVERETLAFHLKLEGRAQRTHEGGERIWARKSGKVPERNDGSAASAGRTAVFPPPGRESRNAAAGSSLGSCIQHAPRPQLCAPGVAGDLLHLGADGSWGSSRVHIL